MKFKNESPSRSNVKKVDIFKHLKRRKIQLFKNVQLFNNHKYYFKTDPRPIYDKKYISFCIKEIKLFLKENDCKNFLINKILFPLKKKVFFQVIYFLFKKLDKNFKIQGKPEDNIRHVLTVLGYPVSLEKSSLLSTNLQFPPVLSNCLNWIIELCLYDIKTISEDIVNIKKELNINSIWSRLIKSYNSFFSRNKLNDSLKKILQISLINYINLKKKKKIENRKLVNILKNKFYFFEKTIYLYLAFIDKLPILYQIKRSYMDSNVKIIYDYFVVVKNAENKYKLVKKLEIRNISLINKKENHPSNQNDHIGEFVIKLVKIFFILVYKIIKIKNSIRCNLIVQLETIKLTFNCDFVKNTIVKSILKCQLKGVVLNFFSNLTEQIYFKSSKIFCFIGMVIIYYIIQDMCRIKIKYFSEFFDLTEFILYASQNNVLNFQNTLKSKKKLAKNYIKLINEKIEKQNDVILIERKNNRKLNFNQAISQTKYFFWLNRLQRSIFLYFSKKFVDKLYNIVFLNILSIFKIKNKHKIHNYLLVNSMILFNKIFLK